MAPLGFSCTKALLATGLLLLWLAPATLLEVQQPQPVLFVEPSTPVAISCILDETQDGRGNVFWYWRLHGERPQVILSCLQVQGEFSCKYTKGRAVLHIAVARTNHTGLYLCAYYINSRLKFGNGTALIVGDSWRAQSWVRVLAPQDSPSDPPGLVCAVGNASGPVLVSWPGGPRPQQVLGLGGSTELLISPAGIAGGTGGLCEVRFNASSPPIRRSVELHGAKGDACTTPSAVARALLLLGLILGICCLLHAWRGKETHLCPRQDSSPELQTLLQAQQQQVRPCGPPGVPIRGGGHTRSTAHTASHGHRAAVDGPGEPHWGWGQGWGRSDGVGARRES
uniref:Ig-like domain-containing protein n=1 Tax=Anas platyrhynchos TaxID=8839 RepID=A0A8B9SYN5_ANAPL